MLFLNQLYVNVEKRLACWVQHTLIPKKSRFPVTVAWMIFTALRYWLAVRPVVRLNMREKITEVRKSALSGNSGNRQFGGG